MTVNHGVLGSSPCSGAFAQRLQEEAMPEGEVDSVFRLNAQHLAVLSHINWEFSSAGSEHLPYKQRVGGSNPSTPTKQQKQEGVEFSTPSVFVAGGANLFADTRI